MAQPMHRCSAIDCRRQVPTKMLMCMHHWRMVPGDVQRRVWRLYCAGQEGDFSNVKELYVEAVTEAVEAVAKAEKANKGGFLS